jgi:single-strand DNA-binding protein
MTEIRLAAINKVLLTGRLTRDAEVRYTPSGTPVAYFSVANNRKFRGRDGEWSEEATFVNAVTMGRGVEIFGDRLKKGAAVFLEGRLHTRTWQNEQGARRQGLEVIADRIQILDRPEESGEGSKDEPGGVEGELPF